MGNFMDRDGFLPWLTRTGLLGVFAVVLAYAVSGMI